MARSEIAESGRVRSVLIYSCQDQIGDGIIKLPFLHTVRHRFPDARITWLSGLGETVYAGALKAAAAPFLDEVIELADVGRSPGEILFPRPAVKGRHFDVIIDTQRLVLRSLILKRLSHSLFISGTAGYLFSDRRPPRGAAAVTSFTGYLNLLADLAAPVSPGMPAFSMPLPESFRQAAAQLLPDGPVYIGISPGAGDKSKCWPLERFISLAQGEAAKGRIPVFLPGPEEKDWIESLRRAVPEALFPEWDRDGIPPEVRGPLFVMALGGRMRAAVANDSGTGHMLAVGGAPLVSIFSKHNPEKYAPAAPVLEIVHARDHGGTEAADIPLASVEAALERLLTQPVQKP